MEFLRASAAPSAQLKLCLQSMEPQPLDPQHGGLGATSTICNNDFESQYRQMGCICVPNTCNFNLLAMHCNALNCTWRKKTRNRRTADTRLSAELIVDYNLNHYQDFCTSCERLGP